MSKKVDKKLVEKYKKKLTVVNKNRRTGFIIAGCVLLAGAGGAGGYFAYKAATRLPDVVVDGYIVKFEGTTLTELKVKKGDTINLKEIKPGEKKGYIFEGWYYDQALTQKCPDTIVINKDITIYAKWTLVVSDKGLDFILNADNNSYTVLCTDEEELYKNIADHDYKLTIPNSHTDNKGITKPITCVGYYNSELDISYGFENLTKIKTINFNNTANEIAPRAFKGCTGLKSVSLENSNIASIGFEAFANCTSNKSLTTFSVSYNNSNSPLVEIGESAFYNNISLETINLTDSLLRISNSAFKDCISLSNVTFHDNSIIQNIGESCFEGCIKLINCNVPYSICKFNQNSFKGCPCTNIDIKDEYSSWCKEDGTKIDTSKIPDLLKAGNLIYKDSFKSDTHKLSFYIIGKVSDTEYNLSAADSSNRESSSVVIPNSIEASGITYYVTRIAEQGFKGSNITSVTIPSSVVTIGADAFYNCPSLSTVEFSATDENSLVGIGDNAFRSSALTAITLPESLLSIGTNAFCYTNLQTINIPKSVTELKYSKLQVTDPTTQEKYDATLAPFYGCHYLNSITVDNNNQYYKSVDGVLFEKNKENIGYTLMRFPELKAGLSNYTYSIPNETTIIASGSFYGNKNAKIINVSNDVLMFNDGAFASADRDNVIEEININNESSLKHIGKYAFDGAKIKTINIGNLNALATIDDYAFYKCSNLTKVEIPSATSYLGLNILANCSKIYAPTHVEFKDKTNSWNIYKYNSEQVYEENYVPVESGTTKQDALSYLRGSNNRIAYWMKNV